MRVERSYSFFFSHSDCTVHHKADLWLCIEGPLSPDGVVVDFAALDKVVKPIVRHLDGRQAEYLTERCSTPEAARVAAHPSMENIALWLAERLAGIVASARGDVKLRLVGLRFEEDGNAAALWTPAHPTTTDGGDHGRE